ncbi:hypothetical protein [Dinghuibacter silviterrae]|nr:hypothetical protein [Dinghuibacter silviterrae]
MRLAPMKAIQQLQLEVLQKFNATQLQPSDCKDLSVVVRDATGKIVSETTIKRFFGFAAQTFNFSVYTLNALSEYAGFQNWEFFLEHYRQQQSPQKEFHPKWKEVKSKTGKISFYTAEAIKNNCGMEFARTTVRTDVIPFRHFLESDAAVSVILGPGGSGKSISLVQAVESFWLNESCLCPNDICLFVHLHQLNTLVNRGFSMEDWLDNQLNLGGGENILDYFEANATEKDGRFVLLVDGIDEKVIAADKLRIIYAKLMDLVFSRARTPWLKVILAARPEAWNALYTPLGIHGSATWPPPQEERVEQPESVQVFALPPLSPPEVGEVLRNHGLPDETVATLSDAFIRLLEFPPFLQLTCSLMDTPAFPLIHEESLIHRVIGHYIRGKVMNSPDYGLKMAILRRIMDDTQNLKMKIPPGQVRLFSGDMRVQEAYRKLLTDHVLEEDNHEGQRSIPVKRVHFHNEYVARFFIATFCLSSHNGELTPELFQDLLSGGTYCPDQTGVLQWVLLYAIDQGAYDAIGRLFCQVVPLSRKALLFEFLLVQPSTDERYTRLLQQLLEDAAFKAYFLRNFLCYEAQGNRKGFLYKPLMRILTRDDDRAAVACAYFLTALHQLDGATIDTQVALLRSMAPPLNREGSALQPSELCLFIYQCLMGKTPDPLTRSKIDQFEEYMVLSDHTILSLKDELNVYLLITCALLLGEYKHLERVTEYIFAEIPSLKMRSHDPFRLLALVVKARFYLYEEDDEAYTRCLSHVENVLRSESPVDGARIVSMCLYQVKTVRLLMNGQYDKMLESVHHIQSLAKPARFNLMDHWCYQMESTAYLALRKQKLSMLAEQEADKIRQRFPFHILPPLEFQGQSEDVSVKRAINH